MWDVTNIIAGGTSFQYGIKHGRFEYAGLKAETLTGETKIVARAIGFRYKGGAKILIGRTEAGFTLGRAPTITGKYLAIDAPKTATGSKIFVKNIEKLIGKESKLLVKGEVISPQLQQELIRGGYRAEVSLYKQSAFLRQEQLFKGTKRLSERAVRSVFEITEKHKGIVYGSSATRGYLDPSIQRSIHDIDIHFERMSKASMDKITKEYLAGLKASGEVAQISAQQPYSIETFKAGKWLKAVELKFTGVLSPEAPIPAEAWGFKLGVKEHVVKTDGLRIADIIGEGQRKFTAITVFKESGAISVGHAQRYKDVGDYFKALATRTEAAAIGGTLPKAQIQALRTFYTKMPAKLGIQPITSVKIPIISTPAAASYGVSYAPFVPVSIPPSPISRDISKAISYAPISSPIGISPSAISSQISKSVSPYPSPSPYISPISPSVYPSPSPSTSPPSPSPYPYPSPSPYAYPSPSVSPSPSPSPSPYYTPTQAQPIPFLALAPMWAEPHRRKKKGRKQPLGYQPSLTAILFGIIGAKPRGIGRGRLSGFEIRPITKSNFKAPKIRLF